MKKLLQIFQKKAPLFVAIAKGESVTTKHSVWTKDGEDNLREDTNYETSLSLRMNGYVYSKLELHSTNEDLKTKFVPGQEYVIIVVPVSDLDFNVTDYLTKDQYGFYDKK